MISRCWNCHQAFEDKVTFRSVCEQCFAYLHCCRGCKHYCPGKPNDCNIPGTEIVADREKANYCEDFSYSSLHSHSKPKPSLEDLSKKIFKDDP